MIEVKICLGSGNRRSEEAVKEGNDNKLSRLSSILQWSGWKAVPSKARQCAF